MGGGSILGGISGILIEGGFLVRNGKGGIVGCKKNVQGNQG